MAHGKKSESKTINITERQEKALQLRRSGLSIREIASRLETSPATIHGDIKTMLAEAIKENVDNAEQLRALEVERLDRMTLVLQPQVNNGHLGAIDRAIRISERRAKLLGLDMSVKQEHVHSGEVALKAYKGISPDDWDAAE
jgi:orotate phosphoribosyltransferase-like protein